MKWRHAEDQTGRNLVVRGEYRAHQASATAASELDGLCDVFTCVGHYVQTGPKASTE